jgi:recombinational DNA repair protein (RecF pathway)
MAGPEQTVTGLVLRRSPRGERFFLVTLLTAEAGLLNVLLRRPGKDPRQAGTQPDLFDTATVRLERGGRQGGDPEAPWFIREYVLEQRRQMLATRYDAFLAASAFVQLIVDNAKHLHGVESLHTPVAETLDRLGSSERPDIVYLKGVYRFLRDEGFPARQQFLPALEPPHRAAADRVLRRPTAELGDVPADAVKTIIQRLHRWMHRDLDMLVPSYPAAHKP